MKRSLVVGAGVLVLGTGMGLAWATLPRGEAAFETPVAPAASTAPGIPSGARLPSAESVGEELREWFDRFRTPDPAEGAAPPPPDPSLPPLLLERSRYPGVEAAAPPARLMESLAELGYDAYRDIRFRPEAALWSEAGAFRLQLFHPGSIHTDQVRLFRVGPDGVRPVRLDPELFRYDGGGELALRARGDAELEPAGFRIHHPLNHPRNWDEVAVFLGASYFRLLGRGHAYGISARGVAVNTTDFGREEFPAFREFWLEDPRPDDPGVRFVARLDGESVTGAYHFHLVPGLPTVLEVEAHLFVHRDVEELGLAPLTSMFLTAPGLGPVLDDLRPRIHDSDGLLVHTAAGGWVWRPLSNPGQSRVVDHGEEGVRGFGLMQRNRDFDAFQDLEARYHQRPSFFVEFLDPGEDAQGGTQGDARRDARGDARGPAGGPSPWNQGQVRLLVLAADSEFDDNVVAFWAPRGGARAGDELRLRYRVLALDDVGPRSLSAPSAPPGRAPGQAAGATPSLPGHTLARVVNTRTGSAELPGAAPSPRSRARRFVVDFAPPPGAPAPTPESMEGLEVVYRADTGQVSEVRAELLPEGRGWRATLMFDPERVLPGGGRAPDDAPDARPLPSELALYLRRGGEPLSEIWHYTWVPPLPEGSGS